MGNIKMTPRTRLHLLAHTLDLALTFLAVRWGLAGELNPLGFTAGTVALKFIVVLAVAVALQKLTSPLAWIIPALPVAVCAWNTVVICAEVI